MDQDNMTYIITSGWWSTEDDVDNRMIKKGDFFIRSSSFHALWYEVVEHYSHAKKIYIIDSNSPVKPVLHKEREVLISLLENAGHSTNHIGKLCGVSRAHLLGMSLAMVNEVDYWVYVEQDALIYGEGIIEEAISKMKKPCMFGSGWGTPQPMQQSFMIIKTDYIPQFIKHFNNITARDNEISPETKFAIACSPLLRTLPEFLFKNIHHNSLKNKIVWRLFKLFQGFDDLPFGYGRVRPINFEDKHFYFQHGEQDELKRFTDLLEKKL